MSNWERRSMLQAHQRQHEDDDEENRAVDAGRQEQGVTRALPAEEVNQVKDADVNGEQDAEPGNGRIDLYDKLLIRPVDVSRRG